jgi:hypothetical protein
VAINSIYSRDYGAVMSARGLRVDEQKKEAVVLDEAGEVRGRIAKGEVVSIHGTTGEVYLGSRALEGIALRRVPSGLTEA